jgi:hypothetical protein
MVGALYFPVFNTKRAEINGFTDALAAIVKSNKIRPLFVPVGEAGVKSLQKNIVGKGVDVFVMMNPHHGPYHGTSMPAKMIASIVSNPDIVPTYVATKTTTPAQIAAFAGRQSRCAFYLAGPLSAIAESAIAKSRPKFVFVRQRKAGSLSAAPILALGCAVNVDIANPFKSQLRGIDYPPNSAFSDRHTTIAKDKRFGNFGDFSVIGDTFSKGGGLPYAIAVHFIHCAGPFATSSLEVAHYVSTRNRSVRGGTAGKVQEACALLVKDNPRLVALERRNLTLAVADFATYASPTVSTNGERMKRLAVKHHMLLMSAIL